MGIQWVYNTLVIGLLFDTDAPPTVPGSYALHLSLAQPARLEIGRLGVFDFPPGGYLYLGSARGPGGLRARLRHHARAAGKPHWHIDYLRAAARLEGVWISTDPARLECAWSQALQQIPGAQFPVPGFGAGDCTCGCAAHLMAFPDGLHRDVIEVVFRSAGNGCRLFFLLVQNRVQWDPGYFL
jgi:Uri superfamily endonuclease